MKSNLVKVEIAAILILSACLVSMPALKNLEIRYNYRQNLKTTPATIAGWKGSLPYDRRVTVEETMSATQDLSVFGDGVQTLASYNVKTGEINILTGADSTRNHEFGHALLVDLVAQQNGGDYAKAASDSMALNKLSPEATDSSLAPSWLVGVADDYRNATPTGALGAYNGYYLQNLNEYFAECYSLYTNGQQGEVPPNTRAFLASVERGEL